MDVDFLALRQNEFWKRKIRRLAMVRDTNGDGYISRADYERVIDRCKKILAPRHVDRFTQYWQQMYDSFGLVDESVKLSYSEYEEKCLGGIKKMMESGVGWEMGRFQFHVLDLDEDGFISFEEWSVYYQILGIDTAHARASFDAIDTNHKGKISEEDFMKYLWEFYLSTENKLNSAILFGPLE